MEEHEVDEAVVNSFRKILQEITPYIWFFIIVRNVIEGESIAISSFLYITIAFSWWIGWLWIILVLLSIGTFFITINNLETSSDLEYLLLRKLLQSNNQGVKLKSEADILTWLLHNGSLFCRFVHHQFHGWSKCTLFSMIYVILTGLTMSYFGIVNTIHATTQGLGVIVFLASVCFTYLPPVRDLFTKILRISEIRRYILLGISTVEKHKRTRISIESVPGGFQIYSGRLRLGDSAPRNSVLFGDRRLLFCEDQNVNLDSQDFIIAERNAVFTSPDDSTVFSVVLEDDSTIQCSAESSEETSEWISAITTLTREETEINLDDFIPFRSQDFSSKQFNFTYSPYPQGFSNSNFPMSYPIESYEDILNLIPIFSSDIQTGTIPFTYILFRTYLFQFPISKDTDNYKFVDLQSAKILIQPSHYRILVRSIHDDWLLDLSFESTYEQWLAAISFALLESQDIRHDSDMTMKQRTLLQDIQIPIHSGLLYLVTENSFEEWYAVLSDNTIFLFLSNSPREPYTQKILLGNSRVEQLGIKTLNGKEYFLFQLHTAQSSMGYVFATSTERSRNLWIKVCKISSKEKMLGRSGSFPLKCHVEHSNSIRGSSQPIISQISDDDEEESFEVIDDEFQTEMSGFENTEAEKKEIPQLQDFPSMFRIPREELEGIGLSVASYELLNPTKKGFLLKRGEVVKKWLRRYFVLKNGIIYYFRDITDRTCAGTIELRQCQTSSPISLPKFPYAFIIPNSVTGRQYFLAADSETERDEWLQIINDSLPDISQYLRLVDVDSNLPSTDLDDTTSVVSSSLVDSDPVFEGYVQKRKKQKFVSNWNRRYFVLREGILKSFVSHVDKTPKTVWTVTDIEVAAAPQQGQKFCFYLNVQTGKKSSYTIALGTKEETSDWIDAIRESKKQMLARQESRKNRWKPHTASGNRQRFLGSMRLSKTDLHEEDDDTRM